MNRVRKLFALSGNQQRLLLKSALLLSAIRMLLWAFPFAYAHPLIQRAGRPSPKLACDPNTVNQIAWSVEVVSKTIPLGSHCLSKAFTAQILLQRRGHKTEVHYGVPRNSGDRFIAHAWLDCEGTTVIGGDNIDRYAELSAKIKSPN